MDKKTYYMDPNILVRLVLEEAKLIDHLPEFMRVKTQSIREFSAIDEKSLDCKLKMIGLRRMDELARFKKALETMKTAYRELFMSNCMIKATVTVPPSLLLYSLDANNRKRYNSATLPLTLTTPTNTHTNTNAVNTSLSSDRGNHPTTNWGNFNNDVANRKENNDTECSAYGNNGIRQPLSTGGNSNAGIMVNNSEINSGSVKSLNNINPPEYNVEIRATDKGPDYKHVEVKRNISSVADEPYAGAEHSNTIDGRENINYDNGQINNNTCKSFVHPGQFSARPAMGLRPGNTDKQHPYKAYTGASIVNENQSLNPINDNAINGVRSSDYFNNYNSDLAIKNKGDVMIHPGQNIGGSNYHYYHSEILSDYNVSLPENWPKLLNVQYINKAQIDQLYKFCHTLNFSKFYPSQYSGKFFVELAFQLILRNPFYMISLPQLFSQMEKIVYSQSGGGGYSHGGCRERCCNYGTFPPERPISSSNYSSGGPPSSYAYQSGGHYAGQVHPPHNSAHYQAGGFPPSGAAAPTNNSNSHHYDDTAYRAYNYHNAGYNNGASRRASYSEYPNNGTSFNHHHHQAHARPSVVVTNAHVEYSGNNATNNTTTTHSSVSGAIPTSSNLVNSSHVESSNFSQQIESQANTNSTNSAATTNTTTNSTNTTINTNTATSSASVTKNVDTNTTSKLPPLSIRPVKKNEGDNVASRSKPNTDTRNFDNALSNRSLVAKYAYDDYNTIYYYKKHGKWPSNTDGTRKAYLRRKSKKFVMYKDFLYNVSAGSERMRLWLKNTESVVELVPQFHTDQATGVHYSKNETISRMLQFCYSSKIIEGVTEYMRTCSECCNDESLGVADSSNAATTLANNPTTTAVAATTVQSEFSANETESSSHLLNHNHHPAATVHQPPNNTSECSNSRQFLTSGYDTEGHDDVTETEKPCHPVDHNFSGNLQQIADFQKN